MHGLIFAGKLTGVPVKTIPTEGATNGAASLTPVQDLWENSFKKIGDENPEQTVTGMLLFYPHQLVGYLEASGIYIYSMYCIYSCEQKHMLLFRKSTFRGCYKPRHVNKRDMLVFEYLNFKVVTCLS